MQSCKNYVYPCCISLKTKKFIFNSGEIYLWFYIYSLHTGITQHWLLRLNIFIIAAHFRLA